MTRTTPVDTTPTAPMTPINPGPAGADREVAGHEPAPPRGRTPMPWQSLLAQLVTTTAGVLFAVMGAVALARTGIPADGDLMGPHVTVGWLHHTPLLAVAHLLVAAGLLTTGWYAAVDGRPSFLGLLGIIAGLVLWIEPGALHPALGVHRAHGATYLLVGLLHLGAGLVMGRSGGVALPTARDGTPTQPGAPS